MKVPGRLCANCKNLNKFTESEKCQECYYTDEKPNFKSKRKGEKRNQPRERQEEQEEIIN